MVDEAHPLTISETALGHNFKGKLNFTIHSGVWFLYGDDKGI